MEYTGSSYEGATVAGRMEGKGEYVFADGSKYVGDMVDGEFHGHGTLHFPSGSQYEADWKHGKACGLQKSMGEFRFRDGLKFDEGDWDYCDEDDRRFNSERNGAIQPAGRSQIQDEGKPRAIPAGSFDVGDGYFEPESGTIRSYDGAELRSPDATEQEWIIANCRVG